MQAKLNYVLKRFFTRIVLHMASDSNLINYRVRRFLYRLVGVNIGKNVFIGTNCYFDELNLKGIYLDDSCFVTRDCVILSHFMNSKDGSFELGTVRLSKGAFLGVNSIISKPVSIGVNSIVGAGSIVTKDIPDNVIAAGNPCKVIKSREVKAC